LEKPVRADIFVVWQFQKRIKLRRSDIMVAVRKDYAAPTGLEFGLGCGSTNMPRLRRYGRLRTTKPRPARPSGSLSGRPQTSRRRLAMTRQAVGEISMPIPCVHFKGRRMILLPWRKNYKIEIRHTAHVCINKATIKAPSISMPLGRFVKLESATRGNSR
jgi:hypothetical protein